MTDYDLFSRAFKRDPFPTFARLRAEQPVYRHVAPNGLAIWYITRYEDVAAALKDERFVKNLRNAVDDEVVHSVSPTRSVLELINRNMLFADPPYHTRLRALISQAFTPRRVEALAPQVETLAQALLDGVAPAGQMDLIDAYAFPLPAGVIMALLGIPLQARDQVRHWSEAIIAPGSRGISYGERKRRIQAFVDYIGALCAERERTPQDDLLTALVQAEIDGDRLTPNELASMAMLLVVTGHETVINLLGNGALALLLHPEQLALLRANPALMGDAVEELLRYDGPVETSTTRWAREDVEFQGQLIRRGDLVRVSLASAGRDEEIFERADELDVTRGDRRHLAFGLGIHYCVGAPLARLEGRIGLNTLLARFSDLRLAVAPDALEWRSGVLFRGLKRLPLIWTP